MVHARNTSATASPYRSCHQSIGKRSVWRPAAARQAVLRYLGFEVVHIMAQGPGTGHPYTSPARIVGGELVYPADPQA